MKKRQILFFLLVFSLNFFCGHAAELPIERLDKLAGKEKWQALSQYMIDANTFAVPPNGELRFEKNDVLISIQQGIRETIEKKGKWIIDLKKELIYFEIPHIEDSGIDKLTFHSFKIDCTTRKNKKYCQIVFYIDKFFKEPKNIEERYGSYNYFHIAPKKDHK
jgi:hypothetical protein